MSGLVERDLRVENLLDQIEEQEERIAILERALFVVKGWVYLTTPLTSTSWEGDSYSTTAKTLIDLSSVFGAPANIKAALFKVRIRDSGASSADCYIHLSPNNTAGDGPSVNCHVADDVYNREMIVVPCDSNGDVYYQIAASDTTTMDIYIQIWGYML